MVCSFILCKQIWPHSIIATKVHQRSPKAAKIHQKLPKVKISMLPYFIDQSKLILVCWQGTCNICNKGQKLHDTILEQMENLEEKVSIKKCKSWNSTLTRG